MPELSEYQARREVLKQRYLSTEERAPQSVKAWARIKLPIKSEEEAYSSNRHETYRV